MLIVTTIALLAAPALLQDTAPPDDSAAREADMFGVEAPDEPASDAASDPADGTPAPGATQADMNKAPEEASKEGPDEAQPAPSEQDLSFPPPSFGLLDDEEKALAIGGQLFLRLNGSYSDGQSIGDIPLSSPSLIDVFADVRPTERLRGFAQVRLTYDYTLDPGDVNLFGQQQEPFQVLLDQVWMKLDLGRVAFITVGRQRIRWGTGRFWNPTDFINEEIRNSVDFFDQRLGVNLLKVHFPFEQLGWNLYLLGTFDDVDLLSEPGVAARAEFLFGEVELALSSLVKKDAPLRFGLDASAGIWLFDVRGEVTVQRGLGRPKFEGELDFADGVVPEEVDTDDDWFVQGVFGGELTLKYTDQDMLIFGGEYFYNQAGYTDASLYPFLALNGAFTPLYLGQHYFGAYVVAPGPFTFNDTNLTVSTLGNVSDGSFLSRLDVQQVLLTYLTFNVFGAVHWGNRGELKLGLDVDPIPGVLPNGLSVPTQIFDFGVAMRMAL